LQAVKKVDPFLSHHVLSRYRDYAVLPDNDRVSTPVALHSTDCTWPHGSRYSTSDRHTWRHCHNLSVRSIGSVRLTKLNHTEPAVAAGIFTICGCGRASRSKRRFSPCYTSVVQVRYRTVWSDI